MKQFLPLVLALILLTGCGAGNPSVEKQEKTVYAMDTVMTLTVYPEQNGEDLSPVLDAAESEIRRLDALLSIANEQGDIYRLNHDGSASVTQETGLLVQRALSIAADTDGAFDPTVYPLMELWGFPTEQYRVPTQEALDTAEAAVGYDRVTVTHTDSDWNITLPEQGGLDLGGIAKGYTAHEVVEVLERQKVNAGILSLGGNVATLGRKPDGSCWKVAVENPDKSGDYLGTMELDGGMFAITSGAYERYFEQDGVRYHHILDPHTGYPADTGLLSVTVVSSDGTLADALSTALFVMGRDKAQNYWRQHSGEFDMILFDGTTLYTTPGVTLDTAYPVTEVTP